MRTSAGFPQRLMPILAQAFIWAQQIGEPSELHGRDLDSLELFSGDMAITAAMLLHGGSSVGYDKAYCRQHEDLCTPEGFQQALHLVMRVKVNGHLWAAPVCSTWGFVGRAGTGRTKATPGGDREQARTRHANSMVVLLSILLLIAWTRSVNLWVEQPAASLMPQFNPIKSIFKHIMVYSVTTYMSSFGGTTPKPLKIFSSTERVKSLRRDYNKDDCDEKLVRKTDGKFYGKSKEMQASQAYPKEFGQCVADIWRSILDKPEDEENVKFPVSSWSTRYFLEMDMGLEYSSDSDDDDEGNQEEPAVADNVIKRRPAAATNKVVHRKPASATRSAANKMVKRRPAAATNTVTRRRPAAK